MSSAAMVSMRQMCGCTLAMVLVLSSVLISVHGLHDGGANKAIQFNGNTIAVVGSTTTAGSSVFNIGTSVFTLSMWVKTSTSAGMLWFKSQSTQNYNVYDCGAATAKNRYEFYTMCIQPNGRVRSFIQSYGGHYTQSKAQPSSQGSAVSSTSITDDQWHFVVTRRVNTATHQVGVDGTFVSYSRTDGNTNVQIPSNQATYVGARGFNGLIDDIRFAAGLVLSDAELQSSMRSQDDGGLYAYFQFNGNLVCSTDSNLNGGIVSGAATYSTNHAPTNLDCAGVWGGTKKYDACGVCDGPVTEPTTSKSVTKVGTPPQKVGEIVTLRYTEVAKCAQSNFAANFVTASFSQVPNGVQLQPTVTSVSLDKNNAQWDISFNATVVGAYTVVITTQAAFPNVANNPFTITKTADQPIGQIAGLPTSTVVKATLGATLTFKDRFGNAVVSGNPTSGTLAGVGNVQVSATAQSNVFSLAIPAFRAGTFTLSLSNIGSVFPQLPAAITLTPGSLSYAQSTTTRTPASMVAGASFTTTVEAADVFGNRRPGLDAFQVTWTGVTVTSVTGTLSLTHGSNGTYERTVPLTVAQTYSLSVRNPSDGQVLATFPLTVTPASVDVGNSDLQSAPTALPRNYAWHVDIQQRDQYGNPSNVGAPTWAAALVGPTPTVNATVSTPGGGGVGLLRASFASAGSFVGAATLHVTAASAYVKGGVVAINVVDFPTATSLQPEIAVTTAGTRITVTGTNFVASSQLKCYFNTPSNVGAAVFVSSTRVECISPALGVGQQVRVEVSTNGLNFTSNNLTVSTVVPCTVTALSTTTGPTFGGFPVTVTGTEFVQSSLLYCRFGTLESPAVATFVSSTQIVCTAPESPVGTVAVEVSNNRQTYSSNGLQFRFRQSFSPSCRTTGELSLGVNERTEAGLRYLPNLLLGANVSSITTLRGDGLFPQGLFDGDRCCQSTGVTAGFKCGATFARVQDGAEYASMTVALPVRAYVNEIVTAWYQPCRNLPKPTYELLYKDPVSSTWKVRVTRALSATFGGGQQPCAVIPGDTGEVALCLDFFEPVETQELMLRFNNSASSMGALPADTDGGWLFEFEAHGKDVDVPVALRFAGSGSLNFTLASDAVVSLPAFDVVSIDVAGKVLGGRDSNTTQVRVVLKRGSGASATVLADSEVLGTPVRDVNVTQGAANVTGLALRAPRAGVYTLAIESGTLDSLTYVFSVAVGVPRSVELCGGTGSGAMTVAVRALTSLPARDVCAFDGGHNAVGASDTTVRTVTVALTNALSTSHTLTQSAGGYSMVQGVATVDNLALVTPAVGQNQVNISVAGVGSVTFTVTLVPGPVVALRVDTAALVGVRTSSNVSLPTLSLSALDAGGAVTTDTAGLVASVRGANASLVLSGSLSALPVAGRIEFASMFATWPAPGTYVLEFNSGIGTPTTGDSLSVTVVAGQPSAMDVVSPSNVSVGVVERVELPTVQLVLRDGLGSLVGALDAGNTRPVVASWSDASVVLTGTTSSFALGAASFDALVVRLPRAGTASVVFASSGLSSASLPVSITPGTPATMRVAYITLDQQLPSIVATRITPASLTLHDVADNRVPGRLASALRVNVTLAGVDVATSGVDASGVQLTGTLNQQFGDGIDRLDYSDWELGAPVHGNYTLRFTAYTSSGAAQSQVAPVHLVARVGPGPPAKLAIHVPPPAGVSLPSVAATRLPAFVVTVQDAGGAVLELVDEEEQQNVTVSLLPASSGQYTLLGDAVLSNATGMAEFDALVLVAPRAGVVQLEVTSDGVTGTALNVTVREGPAHALLLSGVTPMQAFQSAQATQLPTMTVEAVDVGGNRVGASDTLDRTVRLRFSNATQDALVAASAAVPALQGNTVSLMSDGICALLGVTIRSPPRGRYELQVSTPDLLPASVTIDIGPGSATRLQLMSASTVQLTSVAGSGMPLPPVTVHTVDAGGNWVPPGLPGTVLTAHLALRSASTGVVALGDVLVSPQTTWQANVSANGTVTLANVAMTTRAGTYSLAVRAGGLDEAHVDVTVHPGAPARGVALSGSATPVSDNVAVLNTMRVQLYDVNGNAALNANGTVLGLRAVPDDAEVQGTVLRGSVLGMVTWNDVVLVGRHGANYTLEAYAVDTSLGMAAVSVSQTRVAECETLRTGSVPDENSGRTCLCARGYYQNSKQACEPCQAGTYNPTLGQEACLSCPGNTDTAGNFGMTREADCRCKLGFYQPGSDPTVCNKCEEGAVCDGGSAIIADVGFWRVSPTSRVFYDCPNPAACVGGANASCAVGYEGPLCSVCSAGYGKFGTECTPCGDGAVNWFLVVLFVLCGVALLYFLVNTASGPKSDYSIIVKIMLNYLQVIAFVGDFSTRWPSLVQGLFDTMGLALFSLNLHPVDCAFGMTFYDRFTLYMIFPFLAIGGIAVFFLTLYAVRRWYRGGKHMLRYAVEHAHGDSAKGFTLQLEAATSSVHAEVFLRREMIKLYSVTVLVILFIAHPVITKQVFQIFNCAVFDQNQTYLWSDLRISCTDPTYLSYRVWGIVMAAAYCVGSPLLLTALLWRKRDQLNTESVRQRFRFIYEGYKPRHFYWETVILFRKLLVVAVIVFWRSRPLTQMYYGLWVMIAALVCHMYAKPFATHLTSRLESVSLIVTVITLMSGMLYLTPGEVDADGTALLTTILLSLNATLFVVFTVILAHGFYQVTRKQKLVARMGKALEKVNVDKLRRASTALDFGRPKASSNAENKEQERERRRLVVGGVTLERTMFEKADKLRRAHKAGRFRNDMHRIAYNMLEAHDDHDVYVEIVELFTPYENTALGVGDGGENGDDEQEEEGEYGVADGRVEKNGDGVSADDVFEMMSATQSSKSPLAEADERDGGEDVEMQTLREEGSVEEREEEEED